MDDSSGHQDSDIDCLDSFKERQLHSPETVQLLEQNKQIFDRHKGERCFILGAGSSIAKQDLKKLAGEFVLSVSNTFVLP